MPISAHQGPSALRTLTSLIVAVSVAGLPMAVPDPVGAASLPAGFQDTVAISGLTFPTSVRFAPDGRVFVTEKAGVIKVFDSVSDTSATVFADLRGKVHDHVDRGMLGLAVPPNFPTDPHVYVTYEHDAPIGGTAPVYNDQCPDTTLGCRAGGRLSRFDASGNVAGPEEVLIEDWCHQFPTHGVGDVRFGPDGALYVSSGEGANTAFADYGQRGNACADPPSPSGTNLSPPGAQGGALRSQDLRTTGDPATLAGTIIRVSPATGAAMATNPQASSSDANARRIIAYGLRNPFRFAFRPGTNEIWIGDVGWGTAEELNLISSPTAAVRNFGWPCYEGFDPQSGYNAADLTLCESLYSSSGAVTAPYARYEHRWPVAGESCPNGSSSISGLAFYGGGTYPSTYDGALFFADYARDCIYVVRPGSDGRPDWSTRAAFIEGAHGPVDLQIGPNGDLFYVDLVGGAVRRVTFNATTNPPTARIQASPTSGPLPLTVQFDGRGSTDPDGDTLTYSWDLDGDTVFGDSTLPNPARTYSVAGSYTVRLRVSDGRGGTDTDSTVIRAGNAVPVPTIAAPTASLRWRVDQTIAFSGSATDPEDGTVPASRLSWQLNLHHCPSSCHVHLVSSFAGVPGGSFTAQDHEYPSWLELRLSATDTNGATASTSLRLDPHTVPLHFESIPSGLSISVGAVARETPFTVDAIVGSRQTISASGPQTAGTENFVFSEWLDGGSAARTITTPSVEATYTAVYAEERSGFTDIAGSSFIADIQWLAESGITGGCNETQFCPKSPVRRDQMAAFLTRALALPPATSDHFIDDEGNVHEDAINRVADAGITAGCGQGRYCPRSVVLRDQMASFLARALALPPAIGDYFSDDAGNRHEHNINRMFEAAITSGCGGTKYCPSSAVVREQMAAFLHRALRDPSE